MKSQLKTLSYGLIKKLAIEIDPSSILGVVTLILSESSAKAKV